MSVGISTGRLALVSLFSLTLTSCFHPPYNNFQEDKRTLRYTTFGGSFGAGVGAIAGGVAGSAAAGAVIGGVTGAFIGYQKNLRPAIIKELQEQDIQYVQYGDTMTLIVPTDNYYLFNSPVLNELSYPGLMNIVRLLKFYPCTPIYVAAFTDDVGSRRHKKMLSQAQAEAMLTFLWANNIDAHRFRAEGYSDKHPIGNNKWIHGSAYNRRIEIQWLNAPGQPAKPIAYLGVTK
ncbi:C-OmpA-like family protein CmpA [Legionella nagasakiensis]|uniref:C-OmpA-like family protein CmpA n=1 Tax=Legionella nagasakiensis TaxID=535290 RepID=UPI001054BBDF|nr:C-OmpA-like family protein CmpA [Legionella nagasakiensis]